MVYLSANMKGACRSKIRAERRKTIYRMLLKRHGIVRCFLCKEKVEYKDASLEHILEQRNGGTDDMSNLSISHKKCNSEREKNERLQHG